MGSPVWIYLTRRFYFMNYRDAIFVSLVSGFFLSKILKWRDDAREQEWIRMLVYTKDESDYDFKQPWNMSDAAVKREKVLKFADKIKAARAEKEREMMLDAYTYLKEKEATT